MARNDKAPPIKGHLELLYPSKYVKAADLRGGDVTIVIDHLTWENLVMVGGKRDRKVVVHMRSQKGRLLEKTWVVGKTVLRQIADALGVREVEMWSGQRITMYPTECRGSEGKMVECIRVRARPNSSTEEPTPDMMATPDPAVDFADEAADRGAPAPPASPRTSEDVRQGELPVDQQGPIDPDKDGR